MNEILDILQREFVYIWYYFDVQLRQIIGYWVLGILLGIVPASLLGIASPLCMYGTIPLAASFSRSGMRDEWLDHMDPVAVCFWWRRHDGASTPNRTFLSGL